MDTFRFEIVEPLGVISERTDYEGNKQSKEINLVSWNGRQPKVDIREWNVDHTKMGRGITLTEEETEQVCMILHNYMRERGKQVFNIADVENGKPNSTRKGVRAVIDKVVLDDDDQVIGFVITYSAYHLYGSGYFMRSAPQTERSAK